MKVLFVYTNINGFHSDCYSFGLASIVSMARLGGHEARVIIAGTRTAYSKVLAEIAAFKPRMVGFSSVSSQFSFVKEIAFLIKSKYPDIVAVCGGVHPTINPNCVLECESLDAIFVGESENSFLEFLKKLDNGEPYKDTDNLAYAQDSKLVINKLKPLIQNLNSLPYPDKDIYPFREILKITGYAPFGFSRGCPYSCTYCSNHAIAKTYGIPRNLPRYRSVESSINEIEEAMRKFSIKIVFINEDIFGLDRAWRDEFCRQYKKRIRTKFLCFLRANLVDEDLIRQLKDAGCYRVSMGLESGNEYVRNKIMNRQMSNEQIIRAVDLAKKYNLETNTISIIGVPGETEEMLKDTIALNRRIKPSSSGVNVFYPYKGTVLGDYCFEKGLIDRERYDAFSNERRETVLNYPDEYRRKLIYYRENWEALVYPFDLKRHVLRFAKKLKNALRPALSMMGMCKGYNT